jgi:hypothetical protein
MTDNIEFEFPSVKSVSTASAALNARSWKFFADKINATWRKRAGDFIFCGQCLIEAKDELQRDAYSAMLKKLYFDSSVAKKLICIAKNATLGAHVHLFPPCWSTIYELSQLNEDVLKAALDDGKVHPAMKRKDATALRKPTEEEEAEEEETTPTGNTDSSSETSSQLSTAWKSASVDQRRVFLDKVSRDGLCAAMSAELLAILQDYVIGVTIAGASKSSSWAINATDKLHSAIRIAEQQERDDESSGRLIGALRCIALTAERRGIARSDIVIAEGKSGKRRK